MKSSGFIAAAAAMLLYCDTQASCTDRLDPDPLLYTEYYAIGPYTTCLITHQYEMIVIALAELLSERWFPLSTNPIRADQSKVELHCAGWYRCRESNEMCAYRGVGGIRIKSQQ